MTNDRRVFLQRAGLGAMVSVFDAALLLPSWVTAATNPDVPGVSSSAVRRFIEATAKSSYEIHSVIVARGGKIAAQAWWHPYRAQAPQELYSLSKSFTSTAVGFAVAEGKLKLSDKVVDFFPDRLPALVSKKLSALRVEHLLDMTVGHATDSTPAVTHTDDWVKTFLGLPIEFEPGSVFLYDSAAPYMLSAIVQKITGQRLVDYLRPRFFDPLGLPDMPWTTCPRGIDTGGWGLSATTDTIYKFGQFYLQKGAWKGRQLLPVEWIEQATGFKIQQPAGPQQDLQQLKKNSDWHQGYGYLFWLCRHDAFRADGAFGQFCIVLPRLDTVIALTGRTLDMQGALDLVWDHLLPGIDTKGSATSVPADPLNQELTKLALKLPEGSSHSSGYAQKTLDFAIEANALGVQRITLAFHANECRMSFGTATAKYAVTCGIGKWIDGETAMPGTPPEFTELVGVDTRPRPPVKLAAAGAWKETNIFQMQWRYYQTPHFDTVTLKLAQDRIEVNFLNSITQLAAIHAETRPVLKGSRET